MLNKTIMIGKIPTFKDSNSIKASNIDDEQKAVVSFSLSVQKDYKPKDEKYFEEELFNYRAFGKTAQFINKNIKPGDHVYIVSRAIAARKKPDTENEWYPQYFQVENISWTPNNTKRVENAEQKTTATTETNMSNPFENQNKGSEDNPFISFN